MRALLWPAELLDHAVLPLVPSATFRTRDLPLTRRLLCLLSYEGENTGALDSTARFELARACAVWFAARCLRPLGYVELVPKDVHIGYAHARPIAAAVDRCTRSRAGHMHTRRAWRLRACTPDMERTTGVEPVASTLARSRATSCATSAICAGATTNQFRCRPAADCLRAFPRARPSRLAGADQWPAWVCRGGQAGAG